MLPQPAGNAVLLKPSEISPRSGAAAAEILLEAGVPKDVLQVLDGADAIHPGYGFLSENAHFAEVLRDCKIGWIGPPPEVIRQMGDKANARQTAVAAGVPVLPGSQEPLASAEEARQLAGRIGYPVILKAAADAG